MYIELLAQYAIMRIVAVMGSILSILKLLEALPPDSKECINYYVDNNIYPDELISIPLTKNS